MAFGLRHSNDLNRALIAALLLLGVGLMVLGCVVMAFCATRPYPLECRENAPLLTTTLMTQGRNPYALAEQPVFINVYGIAYHWVVYPLARLFGSSFQLHRFVSCLFVLLCALALVWAMRFDGIGWTLTVPAGAVLIADLSLGLHIVARPDSLGLFLFLLSVIVPYRARFRPSGLLAGGLAALLAFFSKPYFAVGAVFVAGYLVLFVGMRRGLAFAALFALALTLAGRGIHVLYPCYFTNVFFINFNIAGRDVRHLIVSAGAFAVLQAGAAGIVACRAWRAVAGRKDSLRRQVGPSARERGGGGLFTCASPDFPACLLVCSCLIMLGMGLHPGQSLLYYHQLVTPFLLWLAFKTAHTYSTAGWRAALLLQVLLTAGYAARKAPRCLKDYTAEWRQVETEMAKYDDVFHCGEIAHIIHKQGKTVYDNSQTRYYQWGTAHNPFAIARAYEDAGRRHVRAVKDRVARGEFEVVILSGYSDLVVRPEARKRYVQEKHLATPLVMNYPEFRVGVWKPGREPHPDNSGPDSGTPAPAPGNAAAEPE